MRWTKRFIQESIGNAKVSARQPCWSKTDFDVKLALKVTIGNSFCNQYRQTRGSISPCNIAGLISDVAEEVATQIAKNCRLRQLNCHLTPPPRGTPANIRINLIFPETRFIGLHFCR